MGLYCLGFSSEAAAKKAIALACFKQILKIRNVRVLTFLKNYPDFLKLFRLKQSVAVFGFRVWILKQQMPAGLASNPQKSA